MAPYIFIKLAVTRPLPFDYSFDIASGIIAQIDRRLGDDGRKSILFVLASDPPTLE